MTRYTTDTLDLRNCDNMELMRQFPDNHFALAIVDPQYGIGEDGSKAASRCRSAGEVNCGFRVGGNTLKSYKPFAGNDKEPPSPAFFRELKRVSRNQIIWGANHFIDRIPNPASPCWVIWDKLNGDSDFADCEMAYTSFKTAVRRFSYRWNGMLQEDMANKEKRIHPTQKPVALYKWLLAKYAKPGDNILDTHLGSCSIAIACHYAGHHLTGCELDPDYFAAGCARVARETTQQAFEFSQPLIPPPRETSTALSLF